ncbi:hypothetical protein P389DRAFT_196443 [Cystobasidium minutum MCA 4210]|uniref:uncharacterized protein n=1 Tax=Cystobasidium minutum MCA 4210 TaxID=1397322 RepID=UPI0034CE1517|eukprot:jgi/Rhomi1/196443/gm1.4657_g
MAPKSPTHMVKEANQVRGLTAALHNPRVTPEGKEKVMDKLEHLGYEVDLEMDVSKLAEHKEDAVHHHTHRALEGDHHHTHHVGQDHDTLDAKKHHHDEHGAEAEHSH